MKIYIYSYINKLNGHRYIGKTNNIERRRREHKSIAFNKKIIDTNLDTIWYKKLRQYGVDNFDFEVLEVANEINWAEREQYWIKYYNTFDGAGYNSTPGGKNGDHLHKLTDEEANSIIDLLVNTDIPYRDIVIEYSISLALLSNINQGLRYFNDSLHYPLRKYYKTGLEEYGELMFLLKNSYLSFKEIAEKLNMGESTVKKINYGTLQYDSNISYPIRTFDTRKIKKVHKELMSDKTWEEVSKSTKISIKTLKKINSGEKEFVDFLKYPLRPEPVSTIST